MQKRLFDIIGASLLLVGLFPLLATTALLIWIDSGRPIFFRQTRAGKNGIPFTILKFRTLKSDCGLTERPRQHETRLGGLLRRWALDELPQLWNILRGDMSLVGPRPTLLSQVEQYGPYERQRLAVRPGLTGWAQIHGRNAISWPERIDLDVWYVYHQSLWLDLSILARTPGILFSGTGVHGTDDHNPAFDQYTIDPHNKISSAS
jgi:lipopolysaccharide/colanic/teichoic acid biosynthesis glycosyltransferase